MMEDRTHRVSSIKKKAKRLGPVVLMNVHKACRSQGHRYSGRGAWRNPPWPVTYSIAWSNHLQDLSRLCH